MQITDSKYNLGLIWLVIATSSVVHIEPAITDLLTIGALGIFLARGLRIPPGFGVAGLLLGLYLVMNVVSALVAPDPGMTLRSMGVRFYMALLFLLFVCLIYENPTRTLKYLWNGYLIAALIAIAAGIVGFFNLMGPNEQLIENGRVRALFKDPNVYGPFLVPVIMNTLSRLETAQARQKMIYWTLLGICMFGLLLGFSRGSYINFAVSASLYFTIRIATQRSVVKRRRVVNILVGLIIGGVVLIAGAATTERVQSMLNQRMKVVQYYDMGEGGRLTRQMEVLRAITVTPFGVGPGQSEEDHTFGKAPHNLYLHVLIEAGWIGGFAFIFLAGYTLWRGGHFIRRAVDLDGAHIAAYTCIIGILVQSVFIDSTHWRHFFLLFALIWGPMLVWQNRGSAALHAPEPVRPRFVPRATPHPRRS